MSRREIAFWLMLCLIVAITIISCFYISYTAPAQFDCQKVINGMLETQKGFDQ